MNNYETVFILNPVLSEEQAKDTVEKFVKVLKKANAEILNNEQWGLRKLAYPINKKSTGFYNLIEFTAEGPAIDALETEYRRDESVMRFLTSAITHPTATPIAIPPAASTKNWSPACAIDMPAPTAAATATL